MATTRSFLELQGFVAAWARVLRGLAAFARASAFKLESASGRWTSSSEEASTRSSPANESLNVDTVSGCPNRVEYLESVTQRLAGGQAVALLAIDIDGFRQINENLGHWAGDWVLQEAARRISTVKDVQDTLFRISGDEFVIVSSHVRDAAETAAFAHAVLAALAQPYQAGEHTVLSGATIGICASPEHGTDAELLARNVELALFEAKRSSRGSFIVFKPEMAFRVERRAWFDLALRDAIAHDQFEVHFQPKVMLPFGQLMGYEALLRWRHPQEGWISPAEFVPQAELAGLIDLIGRVVLAKSLAQVRRWMDEGIPALPVAVNLSAMQFQHPALVRDIQAAVELSGVPYHLLEVEITESAVMADPKDASEKLHELRQLGVSIAIDDFGTGYSSFGQINQFSADTLKIDRSFVKELETHSRSRAIVQAIISMAKALDFDVVAEGVETESQRRILADCGCRYAQGWLFGKAVPASEIRRQALDLQERAQALMAAEELGASTTLAEASEAPAWVV